MSTGWRRSVTRDTGQPRRAAARRSQDTTCAQSEHGDGWLNRCVRTSTARSQGGSRCASACHSRRRRRGVALKLLTGDSSACAAQLTGVRRRRPTSSRAETRLPEVQQLRQAHAVARLRPGAVTLRPVVLPLPCQLLLTEEVAQRAASRLLHVAVDQQRAATARESYARHSEALRRTLAGLFWAASRQRERARREAGSTAHSAGPLRQTEASMQASHRSVRR